MLMLRTRERDEKIFEKIKLDLIRFNDLISEIILNKLEVLELKEQNLSNFNLSVVVTKVTNGSVYCHDDLILSLKTIPYLSAHLNVAGQEEDKGIELGFKIFIEKIVPEPMLMSIYY
jgi:hypothetical protein